MNVLILVVDDEPDMETLFRQQFRRELRSGRLDLAFADSGRRALDLVMTLEGQRIILLLSDVNMPGMSGFELLEKLRIARPDVPVIMITAYGDAETRRKALEGGAEDVLPKPIDFAAVRLQLQQRLAARNLSL